MGKTVIPVALKKAVCDDKLIIFVGAGLSYNLVNNKGQFIKGWDNLVKEIILNLEEQGYNIGLLLPLLEIYDPIEILHLIEKHPKFSRKLTHDIVTNFLELDDTKNDYSLHKKITTLSKKIITTNYDTAFERATPSLRRNTAYKGKNYELAKHKNSESSLLFKLHGCYEFADSMVLFPSNYKQLYEASQNSLNAEHALFVLKNIIYNNTILFIGTGMGDFQINTIFKRIADIQQGYNRKHFIITTKELDSKLSPFLEAVTINDFKEIPNIIDTLIDIKTDFQSKESEEVNILKNQLTVANKKIKELESQDKKSTQEELLEREALKYLREGLELQLSQKYQEAIDNYKTSIELSSHMPDAHNNWGICLANLAKDEKDINLKKTHYKESFDQFSDAIKENKDYAAAYYNWANNLIKLAVLENDKTITNYYKEAIQKYTESIRINNDFHEAYYNLGNLFIKFAKTKKGGKSIELYNKALSNFQEAIRSKPDKHEAYNNCGTVLAVLAKKEEGKKADDLYAQAEGQYKIATEIKLNYHKAFYNWGTLLTNKAELKKGAEKESLYKEASQMYLSSIEHGGKGYNLACLYALQNKREDAFLQLETSLQNEEITIFQILKDRDWDPYSHDPDFIAIIEKFK